MRLITILFLLSYPMGEAKASSQRILQAELLKNPSGTVTHTLPDLTGNLMVSSGIVNEAPSGLINGSNTAYTLSFDPSDDDTLSVYLNGVLMELTTDYTISGTSLTMTSAPISGQSLRVVYSRY